VLSHDERCLPDACAESCAVGLLDQVRPDRPPSRFFFCAKASKKEREAGCEQLPTEDVSVLNGPATARRNIHPTVKPLELMRWLVRLTCPVGGLVLDPFTGSGSTGIAAVLERRQFFGIERERAYAAVSCARLEHWSALASGGAKSTPQSAPSEL